MSQAELSFCFHDETIRLSFETHSGGHFRARALLSQLIVKSQCPLLERIEVCGSPLCFSFHDETEHAFVLP
jgi:hypothetical protein